MYLFINWETFGGRLVRAFSWTLIHSLWQGLLFALVAGLVILRTGKLSSSARYNLFAGLFGLFLLLSMTTFVWEWIIDSHMPINTIHDDANNTTGRLLSNPVQDAFVVTTGTNSFPDSLVVYFNTHASLIALAWFIVFSARCVRTMANMYYVHKIKTQKIFPPPDYWKMRIRELAASLNIHQPITLLESRLVAVPVMVGWLKPVILLPFALLSNLCTEQVEAILLHELAHIRRRDYFVNLVQHLAETVFFFNPGLLWLSSLIRDERENCCDDIAIGQTQNKRHFVHALVAFQEYHLSSPRYATAFPGNRNHLLQRVKRILNNDNKTLDMREKLFLVIGLAIAGFFTIAYSQSHKKPATPPVTKTVQTTIDKVATAVADTTIIPGNTVVEKKDFVIISKGDSLVEVRLKGKKMSPGQIEEIRPLIDEVLLSSKKDEAELAIREQQLAIERSNMELQLEKRSAEQEALQRQIAELQAMKDDLALSKSKNKQDRLHDVQKQLAELDARLQLADNSAFNDLKKLQMDQSLKELSAQKQYLQNEMQMQHWDSANAYLKHLPGYLAGQDELNEKIAELNFERQKQLENLKRTADLDFELGQLRQQQKMLLMNQDQLQKMNLKSMEQWKICKEKYIDPVINDLIDQKIADNRNDISFTLDKKAFIVNGVKQPQPVQRQFADKYLTDEKDHINYSFHNGSESMQVNRK